MSYENRYTLKNGDIVLYTRNQSPTFHARLKIPEVRGYIVQSTKCKDLNAAIRKAEDLYDDLKYKARHGLDVRSHTFEATYRRWVTHHKDQLSSHRFRFIDGTAQRYFLPFFGKRQIEGINDLTVAEYWDWRRKYWTSPDGLAKIERAQNSRTTTKRPFKQKLGNVAQSPSPKSLEMEQSALRQVFHWAYRIQVINRVPLIKAPRVKFGKEVSRRPAFEMEEIRPLREYLHLWMLGQEKHPPPRLNASHKYQRRVVTAYILIMLASGLRPNEARQLRWRDVSSFVGRDGVDQIVLHVAPTTKTGERIVVPQRSADHWLFMLHDISNYVDPDDYIFCSRKGEQVDNFGKTFKEILAATNLLRDRRGRERTIYSLRHTYATFRLLQGIGIEELAQNMGTSPSQIFRHYRHISTLQHAAELGNAKGRARSETEVHREPATAEAAGVLNSASEGEGPGAEFSWRSVNGWQRKAPEERLRWRNIGAEFTIKDDVDKS